MGERRKIRDKQEDTNFFIVGQKTTDTECENMLKYLLGRPDMGIILIAQNVAERVKHIIADRDAEEAIPTILEIPAKDYPYDPEKDQVVVRAASILGGSYTGMERLKELS